MAFASFYPRLDKVCDAPFIKTLLGSTKKDAPSIIQYCNIGPFFEEAEKDLVAAVNSVRFKLEEHIRSQAVKSKIFTYKEELKKKALADKKQREKQDREEIIKEYKRQVRERNSSVTLCNDNDDNDDNDDDDNDDYLAPDRDGPAMTLRQFEVLMQNAILDDVISFKIKPSDNITKPTVKIVNKQLEITIKFSMPPMQAEIPKRVEHPE